MLGIPTIARYGVGTRAFLHFFEPRARYFDEVKTFPHPKDVGGGYLFETKNEPMSLRRDRENNRGSTRTLQMPRRRKADFGLP